MKKEKKDSIKNDTKIESNIWNKIQAGATVFVVIISIISVGFSINAQNLANDIDKETTIIQKELYQIENETYNAIKPFQKPIINLEAADMEANIVQYLDAVKIKFDIVFQFKNYGKGIAQNTKYIIYVGNLEHPEFIDRTSGSLENQTFWFKYTVGGNNLDDLNLEEKTKLLPYYNELIFSIATIS